MTRAVIRVDGSRSIGHGHVTRCLTLAAGLRERGIAPEFVCRDLEQSLESRIRSRGLPIAFLQSGQSSWTWAEDAAATQRALGPAAGDVAWLIVDHYELDARWEQAMRPWTTRVMVVDDMANRPHDADVLLDQNLVADAERRYDGLVSDRCVRLLGPEWALLTPEYADAHARMPARAGRIGRVLVSFGGADADGVTTRVVESLLRLDADDLRVDVVVSAASPQLPRLRALADKAPAIRVMTDVPNLASLLAESDFAIGACGATSWERLAMGVPSGMLTLAENQRPIAKELDRRGLARWLGDAGEVSDAAIDAALSDVIGRDLDERWSRACLETVDGLGLVRTLSVLTSDARTPLIARGAGPADEARILAWANDRGTRATAFNPAPIDSATHRGWFRRRLRNLDGCEFSIVETPDGVPVGQVRLERQEQGDWEVHYLVAPAFRGRGLGRNLLEAGLKRFAARRGAGTVVGRVKSTNTASCRIFEALGFSLASAPDDVTRTYVRKDPA